MNIYLDVENFARIESAHICINQFSVIVGPNNSGKTFLLQLAYGVVNKIKEFSLAVQDVHLFSDLSVKEDDLYSFVLTNMNVHIYVEYINNYLKHIKENLIKEIFGKNIDIGSLGISIELDDNEEVYIYASSKKETISSILTDDIKDIVLKDATFSKMGYCAIFSKRDDNRIFKHLVISNIDYNDDLAEEILIERLLFDSVIGLITSSAIFIPSSRTGLLLTYRDYFVGKTDQTREISVESNGLVSNNVEIGEVTRPLYDFLRFLQTYVEKENFMSYENDLLDFFDSHLLNGHITFEKQKGLLYYDNENNAQVPMFLTSSMINELTPLSMLLKSKSRLDFIIIDEIEASLHPDKQQELLRFLIRYFKNNKKMLITTHSDTIVTKLNNLYLLSEKNFNNNILNKIGLSKDDLFNVKRLFVYELKMLDGKSYVSRKEPMEGVGFQFDMFTESVLKMYNESKLIQENM